MHDHAILQEKRAAEIFDEFGQKSLGRLFPGFTEDILEQATLSVGQSGPGYKRARDIAGPAHHGALIAAKPPILDMIQDAATAGVPPKQTLFTRLDAATEAAVTAYLDALDGAERATAKLYIQKAGQAADESWQGNGPTVTTPTVSEIEQSSSASQDGDDDDTELHPGLSAPQLQAQLSLRSDRTWLRAWTGFGQCRSCGSFLDPQLEHGETCSTAEATRGHHARVHAVLGDLKLADPGVTTEPGGLTETQSRPADLFTTAAVPGRSAALDVSPLSSRTKQQLEETLQKHLLIVNSHTVDLIFVARASFTACLFGQQLGGRTLPSPKHGSTQQASHPAAQWPTGVGKIDAAQLETRNRASSLSTEGNRDAGSPPKPIGTSRMAPGRPHRQSTQPLRPGSPAWWRLR